MARSHSGLFQTVHFVVPSINISIYIYIYIDIICTSTCSLLSTNSFQIIIYIPDHTVSLHA